MTMMFIVYIQINYRIQRLADYTVTDFQTDTVSARKDIFTKEENIPSQTLK